ncbi:TOBE domain-containing protein [Dyella telluris]|uniref:TOBE domain-containing protein n=1 Tax=Dyella telluris TaxID=2763498 RepID=A0A7G8Q5X3_9GAMM|nr:TOBE domain-containing protein [Dyella telluris]QNK02181.1 TOBE domain-containing protein [Dyella telluris]
MLNLKGSLGLEASGRSFAGRDRIALLASIGELGSIAAAARAVGLSYKGAWEAVDAMNNLADEPLVIRTVGGRSGGGATLTDRARRLIEVFGHMETLHQRFVEQLGAFAENPHSDIDLVRRFLMKTSARNQLAGVVASVEAGAVNDVVQLELQGGQRLVATITRESTRSLGLAPGKSAFALIKASSVIIAIPDGPMQLSARNQLKGVVSTIQKGSVNAEVGIQLAGGSVMVSVITLGSLEALGLREGLDVVAIVKASSIILGTLD